MGYSRTANCFDVMTNCSDVITKCYGDTTNRRLQLHTVELLYKFTHQYEDYPSLVVVSVCCITRGHPSSLLRADTHIVNLVQTSERANLDACE